VVNRLAIVIKWALINAMFFFALSLILPGLIASPIACIITVGAFLHPDNEKEAFKLKRPVIYVKV
jgi:hypothetical protein